MDDSCEMCELSNTSSCCTSSNGLALLSTIKKQKQEVEKKKKDCCFIPPTQASPYLRLATNQTLCHELSARAFSLKAAEAKFASFTSPGHGGADGWRVCRKRMLLSSGGPAKTLLTTATPPLRLRSRMLFLCKPVPSCCRCPGCGAQQEAAAVPP